MSKFLRGPSLVLVAGGRSLRESVVSAVSSRTFPSPVTSDEVRAAAATDHDPPVTAESVDDCEAAVDRLAEDPVGCVVLDTGIDEDPVGCVDRVTDRDPDTPVVVTAADGDERLASAATRAGAFAYLPRERDPTTDDLTALLDTVERALREHDRRYRNATERDMFETLLAEIETSIYVKDEASRHLKMADVTGSPSPAAAIGKTDWELYAWDDASKFEVLGDDRQVIDEGDAVREREEQHGPPESRRYLVTSKVPWRDDDGTIRGLVGMTRDATDDRRQIRELRARNRRLDDFASFVSHDLRNPLHVATSFLDFARRSDGPETDTHLAQVEAALDRMEQLIRDLGQLATDEGGAPAPSGGIELAPLLRVVWEDVAPGEASLAVDAPDETTLYTDRLQVKPLFENLFKNAVDHAGPAVTVRVGTTDDGFYVADDGPGIPEGNRDAVFEDGYTTAETGTGTGLSIVSEVAETHGWDLRVTESGEGGARFEFSNVPLVTDPAPLAGTGEPRPLTTGGDVGDVPDAGESSHDAAADSWTLRAAGDNLWGDVNGFHFRRTGVEGPVRIEARLDAFDALADRSKAGVMVRDGTAESDPFGYVGQLGDGRTELLWRTADGEPTRSQRLGAGDRDFAWFRLERCGDRVTASVSADGEDWHAIDQRILRVDDPLSVGLVTCSASTGSYCEATFADVTVEDLPGAAAQSDP